MDLRQLRYFVTLAAEESFTRAAEKLNIAQPPLSRQIQNLEAEVGMELIDRTNRPLKLTSSGRLFFEQAVQVLARVETMRTMMNKSRMVEKRRLVIGFVASTIYARLPALIREFRAEAPQVDLHLVEMTSLEQVAALKEGRIDVGFGRVRFEDEAVSRNVMREETLVAALPASSPLAQAEGAISLSQLAAEPLILYPQAPRPGYADQVVGLFHDQDLQPIIAHEVRELQIALGFVAAEEGYCIVPESVKKSRSDDIIYKELIERVTSPIIMSYRAGDTSPELALIAKITVEIYTKWGFDVAASIRRLSGEAKPEV